MKPLEELAREAAEKEIQNYFRTPTSAPYGTYVLAALQTAVRERDQILAALETGLKNEFAADPTSGDIIQDFATFLEHHKSKEAQLTQLKAELSAMVEARRMADERLLKTEKELAHERILKASSKEVTEGVWKTHQAQFDQLKAELAEARKTQEFYRDGMVRVAKAIGVQTPLELIMMAENNEQTYVDCLLIWIEKYLHSDCYRRTDAARQAEGEK